MYSASVNNVKLVRGTRTNKQKLQNEKKIPSFEASPPLYSHSHILIIVKIIPVNMCMYTLY